MVQNCCVSSCKSKKWKNTNISFHKFPTDNEMKMKWLAAVNVNESNLIRNKDLRVCSLHFRSSDYIFGGNVQKLKRAAVPIVSADKENIGCVNITNSTPCDTPSNNHGLVNTIMKSDESIGTSSTVCSQDNELFKLKRENQLLLEENSSLRLNILEKAAIIKNQAFQLSTFQTEIDYLKIENTKLKQSQHSKEAVFTIKEFQANDKKILYYTGYERFSLMKACYKFVLPPDSANEFDIYRGQYNLATTGRQKSLSTEDQFFMVMMRLRRGFNCETLGDMFGVSKATAEHICHCWIDLMYARLGQLNIWPHRNVLIENSRLQSLDDYKNVIASIICTEFYLEKPSSLIKQSQCYPNSTTLKSLIMADPNGAIFYMSPLFTGSISNKNIMLQSGLLNILKSKVDSNDVYGGDVILADKGFNVSSLFEESNLNINIPTFKITGTQFTDEEVHWIREAAHERIHVERAIGRLKQFRILTKKIPSSFLGTFDQIYVICCVLCNFKPIQ